MERAPSLEQLDRHQSTIRSVGPQMVELLTSHGYKIFRGDVQGKARYRPRGVTKFFHKMSAVEKEASLDDPYADKTLVLVERHLQSMLRKVRRDREYLQKLRDDLGEDIVLSETVVDNPYRCRLITSTRALVPIIRLLKECDRGILQVLELRFFGVIDDTQRHHWVRDMQRACRSVIELPFRLYRHTEVTRNDVAANNPRSQKAAVQNHRLLDPKIQRLEPEFLEGIDGVLTRSTWAPEIKSVEEIAEVRRIEAERARLAAQEAEDKRAMKISSEI